NGHLFIAPGDITQLSADAIAYSGNSHLGRDGNLYSAFEANVPGFAAWYDGLRREHGRRCEVGDAFWLTLDPACRPHGLVLVVSAGGSRAAPDGAGRAVRVALSTAVQRLRGELGRPGRLLIALPTFRVGQGGDRRQRLQSARAQVAAALEVLGQHADVDA